MAILRVPSGQGRAGPGTAARSLQRLVGKRRPDVGSHGSGHVLIRHGEDRRVGRYTPLSPGLVIGCVFMPRTPSTSPRVSPRPGPRHHGRSAPDGQQLGGLLATSLFGDVAAALREHILATLDEHCGDFAPGPSVDCAITGGREPGDARRLRRDPRDEGRPGAALRCRLLSVTAGGGTTLTEPPNSARLRGSQTPPG